MASASIKQDFIIENDHFVAKFDIYTPRPHIILLLKKERKCDISNLSDEEIVSLLNFVDKLVNEHSYIDKNVILSFHTGSWIDAEKFHAHLCLRVNSYIDLFEKCSKNVNFEFDSSNFRVPYSWGKFDKKKDSKKDYYLNKVKTYEETKSSKHKEYLTGSINSIDKTKSINIPAFKFNDKFSIKFVNEPRINFEGMKDDLNLIKAMVDFASKLDMFNRDTKTGKGCHICLNIGQKSDNQSKGYLRLDANEVFYLHPEKGFFLNEIKKIEKYFIET